MVLNKSFLGLVALSVLALSDPALGRMRWLERDGKPVFLHPRRFGQEHPAVIDKLATACPGAVCGKLSGDAITPLLAAQPECSQQQFADSIIDASKQFDAATQATMLDLAKEYRQAEKNTLPVLKDFTTTPPTDRNSVFCEEAPAHPELNGLVQAQDPANDPNVFFDPALGKSVLKGSQPNTEPFGGVVAASGNSSSAQTTSSPSSAPQSSPAVLEAKETTAVTVTASGAATATAVAPGTAVTVTVGDSGSFGNFGSCSKPQIVFGPGFDDRKETSFEPADQTSFNHGSAQNIDIISKAICDTLVNSCGADQTALATCSAAEAAADGETAKTGAQADAFNSVFGITTNFASIIPLDDQGNPVGGAAPPPAASTSASSVSASASASASATAAAAGATSSSASSNTGSSSSSTSGSSDSGAADFGKCTTPEIKFAAGLDGRKETAFVPVDQTSFNHGSADNIDVISQFICNQLTNACGANQAAKDLCTQAEAAADAATAPTGAQADAFNAVFGQTTNFADVTPIDNQGRPVVSAGSSASPSGSAVADPSSSSTAPAASSSSSSNSGSSASAASGGNLQTFTGSLGASAPPVTAVGNGQFQVEGNSVFNNLQSALIRSCDVQQNLCSNAANASGNKGDLTVTACGTQQKGCDASAQA
ncbi:hypothetical protein BC834DRAFT_844045 [Gloeopeniophorella convolvens]|nr:hypothetical protein BC834DRAFT_844045 [Gloeopeniophorella convolvens]